MMAPTEAPAKAEAKVRNLVDLFEERVRQGGSQRAAMHKTASGWKDVTWAELGTRVHNLANGLVARGIAPGDRVSIFAATLLEWCVADLAIVSVGGITVPIYASNTADECQFILNDSGCRAIVVDGDVGEKGAKGRLARILEAREKLPKLQLVISLDPKDASDEKKVVSFAAVEKEGDVYGKEHPEALRERAAAIAPEQSACFIYTSGTTGSPKGVVLSHRSWVYEAQAVAEVGLMVPDEVVLLFLPMAHSFGKVIAAVWLGLGFTVAFCENPDRLMEYLPEVRPTVLPAVPRIFEKVYGGVVQKALAAPGMKGKLAAWAMKEFDAYAAARAKGEEYSSLGFSLAKALVFKKIAATLSERLGGRVRLFVSGSAPLAKKIAYFFDLNGLLILEGYGLTETSAASTVNRPTKNKIGTVGAPLPGTDVKLADDGEILLKGPGVMTEYFNNPKDTQECMAGDGWFKTGDIGEIDADGYVRITDRKKDLIKTSGGKYVAPQFLENVLKTSQIISQVMIHGDRRKYITALVTVNEDVAKKMLVEKGVSSPPPYAELGKHADVQAEIQKAFDALNATLPSYETVKKFRVLESDLTLETGDLTPTLKVKRKVVTQKFMKALDSMYDEPLD